MNYKFYRFLLISYALLILIVSSTPSSDLPKSWFLEYDKIIHFFEYFVFGILAIKSMSYYSLRTVFILILFGFLFGLIDEYLQSFISGRFSGVVKSVLGCRMESRGCFASSMIWKVPRDLVLNSMRSVFNLEGFHCHFLVVFW